MPEIAECYTIAKNMPALKKIKKMQAVDTFSSYIDIKKTFKDLKGFTLDKPFAYGKSIWIPLSNNTEKGFIVSQLGMTGGWYLFAEKNTKLSLFGEKKELHYTDPRMFGKMNLFLYPLTTPDIEVRRLVLNNFNWGIEPVINKSQIENQYIKKLQKTSRSIKKVLLDQSVIFGIGNYLASEILFDAKINPYKKGLEISRKEIKKLTKSTNKIIQKALKSEGFSFGGGYYLPDGSKGKMSGKVKAYGRENETCPSCLKNKIKKEYLDNRATFYCPNCQK